MTLLIWLVAWELLLRYAGSIVTGAPLAMLLIMALLLGAGLTGIALSRGDTAIPSRTWPR